MLYVALLLATLRRSLRARRDFPMYPWDGKT